MQTTTQGCIDLLAVRELFREKVADGEHWLMVVHGSAAHLLIAIEERYYSGDRNEDFTLITCIEPGCHIFAVVAAKKRHMLGYQLASLLRQVTHARISEREMLRRDLIVVAPGEPLITMAVALADRLLMPGDLAIAP